MKEDASGRRQRAVMATYAEWERIGQAAAESGMDLSRFVIHRALDWDRQPILLARPHLGLYSSPCPSALAGRRGVAATSLAVYP